MDTRRQVRRDELYPTGVNAAQVDTVLQRLSGEQARLIVADDKSVALTHEILIRSWPSLRQWLAEDRKGRQVHAQLIQAQEQWQDQGRKSEFLYFGGPLNSAYAWAVEHPQELNAAERQFLLRSIVQEGQQLDLRLPPYLRRRRSSGLCRDLPHDPGP